MFEYDAQDDQDTPLVKQLRAAIDKANAALKAKDEELSKLAGQVKSQSVQSILRDLGIKAKVANLIPSDLDATPESVGKWVKEYEDVFGAALHIEAKPESGVDRVDEAAPEAQARPDVDAATAAALNRLQSSEAGAGVVPPDREQAQLAALAAIGKNSGSAQEVLDILQGKTSLPS